MYKKTKVKLFLFTVPPVIPLSEPKQYCPLFIDRPVLNSIMEDDLDIMHYKLRSEFLDW